MVSTLSLFPEFKADRVDPEAAPHVMIGAASPLWLMFGGAAAAGATWWWWASRWRQAVNIEALSALAPEPLAPTAAEWVEPVAEPTVEPALDLATEAVLEPIEMVAEAVVETLDVAESAGEALAEAYVDVAEAMVAEPPAGAAASELIAAPEAAGDAPVETAEAVADDLTRVVGIGPKLAASLGELGVTRFSQIAAWTAEDIQSIDQLLNLKGRADRDAWIAQAKRFASAATEA